MIERTAASGMDGIDVSSSLPGVRRRNSVGGCQSAMARAALRSSEVKDARRERIENTTERETINSNAATVTGSQRRADKSDRRRDEALNGGTPLRSSSRSSSNR